MVASKRPGLIARPYCLSPIQPRPKAVAPTTATIPSHRGHEPAAGADAPPPPSSLAGHDHPDMRTGRTSRRRRFSSKVPPGDSDIRQDVITFPFENVGDRFHTPTFDQRASIHRVLHHWFTWVDAYPGYGDMPHWCKGHARDGRRSQGNGALQGVADFEHSAEERGVCLASAGWC